MASTPSPSSYSTDETDYSSGDDLSSGDEYMNYILKKVDEIRLGNRAAKSPSAPEPPAAAVIPASSYYSVQPVEPLLDTGHHEAATPSSVQKTAAAKDADDELVSIAICNHASDDFAVAAINASAAVVGHGNREQPAPLPAPVVKPAKKAKAVPQPVASSSSSSGSTPQSTDANGDGFWQDIGDALNPPADNGAVVPLQVVTAKKKKNKKKSTATNGEPNNAASAFVPVVGAAAGECDIFADVHGLLRANQTIAPPPAAPNRTHGAYGSLTDYLHTQMRLLRTDYFVALQAGVQQLRDDFKAKQKADAQLQQESTTTTTTTTTPPPAATGYGVVAGLNSSKFWVFANKRITMQVVRRAQHCFCVKLSSAEVQHLLRQETVRSTPTGGSIVGAGVLDHDDDDETDVERELRVPFMFGSLLLFAPTMQMNELTLATVVSLSLDDNLVQILPMRAFNAPAFLDKPMFMLESKSFFDPAHQIHRALAAHNTLTFPLQPQLILACTKPVQPGYLAPGQTTIYRGRGGMVLPLQPATAAWPSPERLGYNPSQVAAIRHALTNRIALIQGPPGTGKSFVGRELVGLLLHNTPHRIVIVCNSNQALDQFLRGLLDRRPFGGCDADQIVRMGNQCKDTQLKTICKRDDKGDLLKPPTSAYCAISTCNEKIAAKQGRIAGGSDCSDLNALLEDGVLARRRLDEMHHYNDFEQVRKKRVIGMTSSFAAKCGSLLLQLQSPIVIVEEAAEMLETHVVTALTKYTQHLIQIGDHKQLRPRTCSHKSARDLHMDVSLFERLHNNQFASVQLTQQHRMHPLLADLIRPSIYATLTDAPSVHDYPEVVGMPGRVQFIDHRFRERSSGPSRYNAGEATFVQRLCAYLLLQGYTTAEITVLCTYRAQIVHLETRRGAGQCHGCEIAVVDGFQGRENRIVLLSLVRNNADGAVGFMSAANRACVALSRAREGLYIFGNLPMLRAAGSEPWMHVQRKLSLVPFGIGEKVMMLRCVQHKNLIQINDPKEDGWEIADGGCSSACVAQLSCGHRCLKPCHALTIAHACPAECSVVQY